MDIISEVKLDLGKDLNKQAERCVLKKKFTSLKRCKLSSKIAGDNFDNIISDMEVLTETEKEVLKFFLKSKEERRKEVNIMRLTDYEKSQILKKANEKLEKIELGNKIGKVITSPFTIVNGTITTVGTLAIAGVLVPQAFIASKALDSDNKLVNVVGGVTTGLLITESLIAGIAAVPVSLGQKVIGIPDTIREYGVDKSVSKLMDKTVQELDCNCQ